MRHYFQDRDMVDLKKTCAVVAFRLDGRKSKTHSFFDKDGKRYLASSLNFHKILCTANYLYHCVLNCMYIFL